MDVQAGISSNSPYRIPNHDPHSPYIIHTCIPRVQKDFEKPPGIERPGQGATLYVGSTGVCFHGFLHNSSKRVASD